MTPHELQYKRTVTRLGIALLLFEALFFAQTLLLSVLTLTLPLFLAPVAEQITYSTASGLLYALTFVVPIWFYRWLSKDDAVQPMRAREPMPRKTVLYVLFGLAVVSAAAYLNALILGLFDYGSFAEDVLHEAGTSTNLELVLLFFTLAVVPAFVEEFLFRGLVLSNLLPYGRTTAVLASAVLFGVMHQNVEQLLYATAAGLVIGWVYVCTGSIWPCILLHFCNNLRSVLQTGIMDRLPAKTANAVLYVTEGILLAAAIVAALLLFLRERDKRAEVRKTGAFEVDLAPDVEFAERPVSARARVKLFFSVPMVAFLVICCVEMISLLLLSLLSKGGTL